MHILLLIPAVLLPAFGRRVAGGAFQQWTGIDLGDTPVRMFFGATVAAVAWMAGALWWHALLLVPAIWTGTTAPNFGAIAMGRSGNPFWRDFGCLTAHGVLGVLAAALGAWWLGYAWWWLLGAGLLISPLYSLAWALTKDMGAPAGRIVPWLAWFNGLRGGSEVGEFLWGATIGAGTILAVVLR